MSPYIHRSGAFVIASKRTHRSTLPDSGRTYPFSAFFPGDLNKLAREQAPDHPPATMPELRQRPVAHQNSIAPETNDLDARGPAGNGTLRTELSPSVTLK